MTDFWIKENDIPRLFECLQFSESTACWQKRRCNRIVALCVLLKKTLSYPYRCKDVLPLFGRDSSLIDIYTQFYLSASPPQTRFTEFVFFKITIFTEICRCSSWKRCIFTYLSWLCWWNNCLYLYTGFKWKGGI